MRGRFSRCFRTIAVSYLMTASFGLFAQEEEKGLGADEAARSAAATAASDGKVKRVVKKREAPPNFLKFRLNFKEICELMEEDGRRDEFVLLMGSHTEVDASCPGCKPFFIVVASSCRPQGSQKKERKKKNVGEVASEATPSESPGEGASATPSPVEKIKQRIPSAAALDSISRCFQAISEEETTKLEIFKVAQRFITILQNGEKMTAAESEYFQTMAVYVHAPFEEYEQELEAQAQKDGKKTSDAPTANVDELFE